jgi:type VI secretion system secreted protein VgrG
MILISNKMENYFLLIYDYFCNLSHGYILNLAADLPKNKDWVKNMDEYLPSGHFIMSGEELSLINSLEDSLVHLESLQGEENLSETYRYKLDIRVENKSTEASVDLQKMLGQDLTTTYCYNSYPDVYNEINRTISGIVTEASLLDKWDYGFFYQVIIEPWLVLAKRSKNYRIFQNKTVVEIIDEVLGGNSSYLTWRKRLVHSYPLITYEVQYGESDFDFIQRLMERYGIYWFFEHSLSSHCLILIDNPNGHIPVAVSQFHQIAYRKDKGFLESITEFSSTDCLHSGVGIINDYDFTKPKSSLLVNHVKTKENSSKQLSIYEWPGNYVDSSQGEEYARIRMEERYARSLKIQGRGNLSQVVCGTTFQLNSHTNLALNQHYLVTHTRLDVKNKQDPTLTDAPSIYLFDCEFSVQPKDIAWRPERKTPLPRTTGPQTAIVAGPLGQEIWTDNYGRVKLKFHWDLSEINDHNSSCWIRVSYPWAGNSFGGINIPRVGTEVIVDFENGDPNRPIITGRVYNALTMPPWVLPLNASQSGLLSRSIGGELTNGNALRFEDILGLEEIWLQAERDLLTQVKNNEVHQVTANRSKSIGGNEQSDIQGDRNETVTGDQNLVFQANRTRSVAKDDTLTIDGNQQTSIKGQQQIQVQQDRNTAIEGNSTLVVSGKRQVSVGNGQQTEIQQDLQEKISANHSTQVGQNYEIEAGDKFEITVGLASFVLNQNGSITINGKDITISGSSIKLEADTIDIN